MRAVKDLALAGTVVYAATQGGGVLRLGGPSILPTPSAHDFGAVASSPNGGEGMVGSGASSNATGGAAPSDSPTPAGDKGCGCALGAASQPSSFLAWLLFLAALGARRRERHSSE
jgi:MYXO-CTERM domain-containing protein